MHWTDSVFIWTLSCYDYYRVSFCKLFINTDRLIIWFTEPARITEAPSSVKVLDNSVLSLVCRASGNPTPEISWSRGGKRIQTASAKRYTIIDIPGGSVLRISPVRSRRDDGYVDCIANNGVSEPASAEATIHVYTRDNGPSILFRVLLIPRLHDRENIEQTSSKCVQNTRANCSKSARRLLDVC